MNITSALPRFGNKTINEKYIKGWKLFVCCKGQIWVRVRWERNSCEIPLNWFSPFNFTEPRALVSFILFPKSYSVLKKISLYCYPNWENPRLWNICYSNQFSIYRFWEGVFSGRSLCSNNSSPDVILLPEFDRNISSLIPISSLRTCLY